MIKKALFALAISGAMASAHAGVLIDEGFDDVRGLGDKGWVLNNGGVPAGATGTFYQGDQAVFEAHSGAPESYAAANYGSASAGGNISNWLITPEFSTALGVSVSFWLRADAAEGYFDQVSFGFSNGSTELSAFNLLPAVTVAAGEWIKYVFNLDATAGTGRFAIGHVGAADSSNYIGVDSLSISELGAAEVPEPASILILAAGAMGLAAARRRKRA